MFYVPDGNCHFKHINNSAISAMVRMPCSMCRMTFSIFNIYKSDICVGCGYHVLCAGWPCSFFNSKNNFICAMVRMPCSMCRMLFHCQMKIKVPCVLWSGCRVLCAGWPFLGHNIHNTYHLCYGPDAMFYAADAIVA